MLARAPLRKLVPQHQACHSYNLTRAGTLTIREICTKMHIGSWCRFACYNVTGIKQMDNGEISR